MSAQLTVNSLVLCKLSISSIRSRTESNRSSNPSSSTTSRAAWRISIESGLISWLIYDEDCQGTSLAIMDEELTSIEIMLALSSSRISLSERAQRERMKQTF